MNRIEKEERKFYCEVEKENAIREEKRNKLEMKRKEKENFVKKFFPSCVSSPGGTQNLVANKPTDVTSAEGRGVGKVMAWSSGILSTKTVNFTNNSLTDTHNTKKELDMQTSLVLFGGTGEISTESKPTNHRRRRGRGNSYKRLIVLLSSSVKV